MGHRHPDHYKRLKMMQDADLIVAECRELLDHHGIGEDAARPPSRRCLHDQPLPLQGKSSRSIRKGVA